MNDQNFKRISPTKFDFHWILKILKIHEIHEIAKMFKEHSLYYWESKVKMIYCKLYFVKIL